MKRNVAEEDRKAVANLEQLQKYLKETWPDLWEKVKDKTFFDFAEHLDLVCGFKKTYRWYGAGEAAEKWYKQLKVMYALNGPIEF